MNSKNDILQLGNVCPTKTRDNPNQGRVYDINGLSPAINCMTGGNRQPMILVEDKDMKVVCENRMDEGLRTFKDGVCGTIRTIDSGEIKE